MVLGKPISEVFSNFCCLREDIETREGHANFNEMFLHQSFAEILKFMGF